VAMIKCFYKHMHEVFKNFKNKTDILVTCDELLSEEKLLDEILKEISTLKRGHVPPEDTIRRSKVGSYFSATIQQIGNFVDKKNIILTKKRKTDIKRLSFKADKILRENIILQSIPPLDVIKFKNVPVRHSYSSYGRRELRWGYGLHKNPFNENGNSITVANTPPFYTQSLHNHKLSEYCLILDSSTEAIFFPGGKKEKLFTNKKSQILHFFATTPHTLKNPLKSYSRNITYKQAAALTDWRPYSELNEVKSSRATLIKGSFSRINKTQTHKLFTIKDKFYNYTIEIIRMDNGSRFESIHPYDQYIFVINGRLIISHEEIQKKCKKNDFIVIDKNTKYVIKADTFCRLYTIIK
jgi:mannose-6-phosphate isomerase-like protein (cupin superfamily)